MFNLGRLRHLARALGLDQERLLMLLDDFDKVPHSLVRELTVWPAKSTKKPRDVISLRKPWRTVQERIYLRILLPRLAASRYSHGGVHARNAVTNARAHIGNRFGFVTDIAAFYPSIRCRRVSKVFTDHGCGYDVARALTRLCTYDHHLALGLITSPILANEIFKEPDVHIANACRKIGLVYTRFVDDITISGNFDLASSGIASIIKEVVGRYGFALAASKTRFGRFDRDICVTGVRITGNHINPSKTFDCRSCKSRRRRPVRWPAIGAR